MQRKWGRTCRFGSWIGSTQAYACMRHWLSTSGRRPRLLWWTTSAQISPELVILWHENASDTIQQKKKQNTTTKSKLKIIKKKVYDVNRSICKCEKKRVKVPSFYWVGFPYRRQSKKFFESKEYLGECNEEDKHWNTNFHTPSNLIYIGITQNRGKTKTPTNL